MAGEDQAQKRAAAEAYAFDEDSRWIDYWNNVLIPPQMSARSEVRRHFQLKFFQRFIDSELEVQPLSSLSENSRDSSAPPRPSVSAQQRPASTQGSTAQSTAGNIPPRPPARATPRVDGSLQLDQKSFQFLNNGWVVVMAILAVFPLPLGGISDRGYRLSLAGCAVACGHCLYLNNRGPRTWNLQGLQQWMQAIVPSKDFLSLLYSLIFLTSIHPVKYAVIPVLCRSLEHAGMYLRGNFSNTQLYKRFLQRPCDLLANNQTKLQMASANAEIGIGFMLIFMILTPQRNLVQALIYWQLLKLYYRAPSTSLYHQRIWARIGARANPLIHRFAPILERPLDYVRNWFLRSVAVFEDAFPPGFWVPWAAADPQKGLHWTESQPLPLRSASNRAENSYGPAYHPDLTRRRRRRRRSATCGKEVFGHKGTGRELGVTNRPMWAPGLMPLWGMWNQALVLKLH